MDFENLEETLLNSGKEKGAELAENFLSEQQAQQGEGSLTGMGIGYGKNMLENYLGGNAPENPDAGDKTPFGEEKSAESSAEMSTDEANPNDDNTEVDSNDDSADDSDDKDDQSSDDDSDDDSDDNGQ